MDILKCINIVYIVYGKKIMIFIIINNNEWLEQLFFDQNS